MHGMKCKGQQTSKESAGLFCLGVGAGLPSGAFWRLSVEGSIPSDSSPDKFFPVNGCSHSRGMSSGMSQGQDWKPTVIVVLTPEESKGQNDMRQVLSYR